MIVIPKVSYSLPPLGKLLTDAEIEADLRRLDEDPRDTNQLKKQKVQAVVRMYRRRAQVQKQAGLLPPRWCRWVRSWQERAIQTPVRTLGHLQRIAKEKGASLVRDKYMYLKEEQIRAEVRQELEEEAAARRAAATAGGGGDEFHGTQYATRAVTDDETNGSHSARGSGLGPGSGRGSRPGTATSRRSGD